MAQFGAGPELAAQCPTAPIPDGWRPWYPDTDGPVPDALVKRADAFASDTSLSLGATESYPLPGVTVLIRIEPHVWGRDEHGDPVQGCFRAALIYLPSVATSGAITPPSDSDKISKTVGILTAVSLAVGTVATIVTLRNGKAA